MRNRRSLTWLFLPALSFVAALGACDRNPPTASLPPDLTPGILASLVPVVGQTAERDSNPAAPLVSETGADPSWPLWSGQTEVVESAPSYCPQGYPRPAMRYSLWEEVPGRGQVKKYYRFIINGTAWYGRDAGTQGSYRVGAYRIPVGNHWEPSKRYAIVGGGLAYYVCKMRRYRLNTGGWVVRGSMVFVDYDGEIIEATPPGRGSGGVGGGSRGWGGEFDNTHSGEGRYGTKYSITT